MQSVNSLLARITQHTISSSWRTRGLKREEYLKLYINHLVCVCAQDFQEEGKKLTRKGGNLQLTLGWNKNAVCVDPTRFSVASYPGSRWETPPPEPGYEQEFIRERRV